MPTTEMAVSGAPTLTGRVRLSHSIGKPNKVIRIEENIEPYKIEIEVWPDNFKRQFGRSPRDLAEFEEFCYWCEKGLINGHIDLDMVFECAHDAMQ